MGTVRRYDFEYWVARLVLTVGLLALLYATAHAGAYLPYVARNPAPIVAVAGHGEAVAVSRDWALVNCANGPATAVAIDNDYLLIKCEGTR